MVTADWHIHSTLSFDGRSAMEDMCRAALAAGLEEICFTEHHDIEIPGFGLDIPRYRQEIQRVRALFPALSIRMGIEAGDTPTCRAQLRRDIGLLQPDYVLLSTHLVQGIDPYFSDEYFAGRTRRQGMLIYLEAMLETVSAWEEFDTLAHLGYAGRYAPRGETPVPLRYDDFPELIDAILSRVIRLGKALEINTARQETIPGPDILRRYHQLGGRRVILGSDAHDTAGLAHRFAQAEALAEDIGLVIGGTPAARF